MNHTHEKFRSSQAAHALIAFIAVAALLAGCGGSETDLAPVPESPARPQAAVPALHAAGKLRAGAATTQDVIDRAVSAQAAAQAVAGNR